MRYKLFILVGLAVSSFSLGQGQVKIQVHADQPGALINPGLYGIFFEEINHAGEGGIYGELIRNRGFEANRLPEGMTRDGDYLHSPKGWIHRYSEPDSLEGWSLQLSGDARASISQVGDNPLNSENPKSMKVEVKTLSSGNVNIINSGFWGINIEKGKTYNLSFYARCDKAFKGGVEVRLENGSGQVFSSQNITGVGENWKKFSCTFLASGASPQGKFVISPLSRGTVWFDVVSLFPAETYKNRTNGMRKDIAQLIENIKPGFLRFPGGCIVEGATMENRVKWKNCIGDISQRPGHWVLWDYYSSDGMGFQEYLQFCEDLGCAPMYVIPVGMSCQFRKSEHVDKDLLQPYIDEVMDALEYAMGPVTSKWGAERSKNGHPAPFKISYIEIGNENYGPVYQGHYNYFYKAIKDKYPQLHTITCTDPAMRDPFKLTDLAGISAPVEMIDEHFYESPDFFYKNTTRYDTYDRKGPNIYVGEYAVKKWDNTLKGNLDASLAEAAFMTGLERNADIVKLTSMAPTFINKNDPTWNPDLITYDDASSYGSPSYQVQKLFASNLPERVLPVSNNYPNDQYEPSGAGHGVLGLDHIDVEAEYKDIAVTVNGKKFEGATLFPANVLKTEKDGVYKGTRKYMDMPFLKSVYESSGNNWDDYTLTLKAKANVIDDNESLAIIFFSKGQNKNYRWNIGRWGQWSWLQWYDNGYESYFGQQRVSLETGKWYDISIHVKGDSIFCFFDNKLMHSVKMPRKVVPGLYTSAGENSNGEVIIKVVNATDEAQKSTVELLGTSQLKPQGKAYEISATDRYAKNTFDKPENVSTKETDIDGVTNNFSYTFAPHSVTVLKLFKNKEAK
jgi:alpha-L-arabinofuranosidase